MWVFLFLVMAFCFLFQEPVFAEEATSLQPLIDRASEGDIIILENKTYIGPISIDKPLTLQGEKGTIIEGDGKTDVITVDANDVTIRSVKINQSGLGEEHAGIILKKVERVTIESNTLEQVQNGIFVRGGRQHTIRGNEISSYDEHFSKRGNAVHLLATKNNVIEHNKMNHVQDGVYLDDATDTIIQNNRVTDSRYALHFMFSRDAIVQNNRFTNNMNGIMAMNSEEIRIADNLFERNLNYRGFGVLIYEMKNVDFEGNQLLYNHTGLEIQSSENVTVKNNVVAGNYIGLASKGLNEQVIFSENEMVGNIIQAKLAGNSIALDDGFVGNYWDDYRSYDLTGNGIGEVPYEASSSTSDLLQSHPHLQFYFESPAMTVWQSVEKMFSNLKDAVNTDRFPIVK